MKLRALLYSGALVAVSAGSFLWGEHIKVQEERSVFLESEANHLAIEIQIAAMTRAGDIDRAIHRAEGFIVGDVLTLAMYNSPDQPPLTQHQLSVLRLAAEYRDLYPTTFEKPNAYDDSIKPRVDRALDLGARSGATEYQWFSTKYLGPADRRSGSGLAPSTSP
ncbi:hypothetical protein [Nevskia soli]|uniref:hypothetical protein n=1 Tax=Nevskia soli TaxID=418856 RepID=UPI0012FC789B|nr:hypothetical protein [Nevskia soli]